VISTASRSCRGATATTVQSLRGFPRSRQEVGLSPASSRFLALGAGRQQLLPARIEGGPRMVGGFVVRPRNMRTASLLRTFRSQPDNALDHYRPREIQRRYPLAIENRSSRCREGDSALRHNGERGLREGMDVALYDWLIVLRGATHDRGHRLGRRVVLLIWIDNLKPPLDTADADRASAARLGGPWRRLLQPPKIHPGARDAYARQRHGCIVVSYKTPSTAIHACLVITTGRDRPDDTR